MADPKLTITSGGNAGSEYPLTDRIIFNIGSDQTSSVFIEDEKVSPNHCRLYREEGKFTLFDVSGKGLTVNGKKLVKAELTDGDVIGIGDSQLRFTAGGGTVAASPPSEQSVPVAPETVLSEASSGGGRPIATVTVVEGNDVGRTWDLNEDGTYVMGRGHAAELTIMDIKVSRAHTRIDNQGGIYTVTDLNSTNGTILNGEKIDSVVLKDGDHIKIGYSTMRFNLEGVTEAPAVTAPVAPPTPMPFDDVMSADPEVEEVDFDDVDFGDEPVPPTPPPAAPEPVAPVEDDMFEDIWEPADDSGSIPVEEFDDLPELEIPSDMESDFPVSDDDLEPIGEPVGMYSQSTEKPAGHNTDIVPPPGFPENDDFGQPPKLESSQGDNPFGAGGPEIVEPPSFESSESDHMAQKSGDSVEVPPQEEYQLGFSSDEINAPVFVDKLGAQDGLEIDELDLGGDDEDEDFDSELDIEIPDGADFAEFSEEEAEEEQLSDGSGEIQFDEDDSVEEELDLDALPSLGIDDDDDDLFDDLMPAEELAKRPNTFQTIEAQVPAFLLEEVKKTLQCYMCHGEFPESDLKAGKMKEIKGKFYCNNCIEGV